MMKRKIKVKGKEILLLSKEKEDYISLTDIARYKNAETTGLVISHWLSTRYTIEFLGIWERINNPNFNVTEFSNIKNNAGSNGFVLSNKQWIEKTGAIGIISKSGRYTGGTYAHKDIAFEFASWISPEFKLYLIKDYQRLKEQEIEREKLGWDLKRNLAKINYRIHTDAIKEYIIPKKLSGNDKFVYANEADLLNKALFGQTALEWKKTNPDKEGNIRDYADVAQLVVLVNLENLNAEFIRQGLVPEVRLEKLNEIAIMQIEALVGNRSVRRLEDLDNKKGPSS
ncbi:MAG: KilA-N domain-containing protein [Patescibacteria group bacterium]